MTGKETLIAHKTEESSREGRSEKKSLDAQSLAPAVFEKFVIGEIFTISRNLEEPEAKSTKGRNIQVRPKSEKFPAVASEKTSEIPSNIIQRNLDDYIFSLSNFELKKKLESCSGNLIECPVLNDFREELKKSISNHVNLTYGNQNKVCKTSRMLLSANNCRNKESSNVPKQATKENEGRKSVTKKVKAVEPSSNSSRGMIRSTRAQDLRSQSNRDLLKPKTTNEKLRMISPYVTVAHQKKTKELTSVKSGSKSSRSSAVKTEEKKFQLGSRSEKNRRPVIKDKVKKEKCASVYEEISLQRQKTQEIINPKIVKKGSLSDSTIESAGDGVFPQLKKSQTFFICKGSKNGNGDDNAKNEKEESVCNSQKETASDGNATDDENPSPKLKPLTHNDSFCLIVKSSQSWSQKNRSDDEKWLHYGLAYEEKTKKTNEKGILKSSNYDLKSVDSLEKVESEKIVRFSDELLKNKKVLKKHVRRKKRLQNFFTPNWYQKNKLFQKYLQILKEKSVLLSDHSDAPEDLKPYRVPLHLKERYEAEMFGLCPRKGKVFKNQKKDSFSY